MSANERNGGTGLGEQRIGTAPDVAASAQAASHPTGPASTPRPADGAEQPWAAWARWTAWSAAWLWALALAGWVQRFDPAWLAAAALGALGWTLFGAARLRWLGPATTAALWATIGIAAAAQRTDDRIAADWPAVRFEVEERTAATLRREMDALWSTGQSAARAAARIPVEGVGGGRNHAFARLATLRARFGVHAVARFDRAGVAAAWSNEHWGPVPEEVRLGRVAQAFRPGPVFSYLYFAVRSPDGGTGVAATLLEANVDPGGALPPFAAEFDRGFGVTPRFSTSEQARGSAVWDWTSGGRAILSVSFAELTQQGWGERAADRSRRFVVALWVLGVIGLAACWLRVRAGPLGALVVGATSALLLLPLGEVLGTERLVSPLGFVAPVPGDPSLGDALALTAAAALWVLGRRGGRAGGLPRAAHRLLRRARRVAGGSAMHAARAGVAAIWLVAGVDGIRRSATEGLLASAPAGGWALQLATTLVLALPLWIVLPRRTPRLDRRWTAVLAVAAALAAAGLAVWTVASWRPDRPLATWTPALWALPFALLTPLLCRARPGAWRSWLAVGWLASTAAVSHLWTEHLGARVAQAEEGLARLGTADDPYLNFLLDEFAERTRAYAAEGVGGVDLLYRSWIASGLAREGYPARLAEWQSDQVVAGLELAAPLPVGDLAEAAIRARLPAARLGPEPRVQRLVDNPAVHYLLLIPIDGRRTVSVTVPPRRQLGPATPLARFLAPAEAVGDQPGQPDAQPELRLLATDLPADPAQLPRWLPTQDGWRGEATVGFPEGPVHAHLLVRVPPPWLLGVQGGLATASLMGALLLLWAMGRLLAGSRPGIGITLGRLWSFRGRLTIALALFFAAPTALAGYAGYRVLGDEAVRTTGALAQRSLQDAARRLDEPGGVRAAAVGGDLLLYQRGVLRDASSPELLDLGLFSGWLPPTVYLSFVEGETTAIRERRRLGGEDYLLAYRRVPGGRVLAVPAPLATGQLIRRQRELRDVVVFAALIGATLSLVLSLAVGRALAHPIDRLSRAAAAVGRGNLRVRLPEQSEDEFGSLNRSFNRMVRRLRRGRQAEIQAARLVAWGEMARQVAHEIKNPLTPIKLSVQHLRRAHRDGRADFPEILDRNVDAVLHEIDRLSGIARAFARFGTPAGASGPPEAVNAADVVGEMLALYRGGADGIEYRVEIAPDTPPVRARSGELKEVLVNLLENSRAALDGEGGTITLRTVLAPEDGGRVHLEVEDSGSGIDPEQLPRIFDPQFSTRTSGTGLGLAIVRRLVEGWGATVAARSEPGRGTTIRMRLLAAAPLPSFPAEPSAGGDGS